MNIIDHAALEAAAAVAAAAAANFMRQNCIGDSSTKGESCENVASLRQVSPPCTPMHAPIDGVESVSNDNVTSLEEIPGDEASEEDRLARNRERNREHARRTRLRKKEQLKKSQERVKVLEEENEKLKLSIEECNVASILISLAKQDASSVLETSKCSLPERELSSTATEISREGSQEPLRAPIKRKRFVSNADEIASSKGSSKSAKKTQINWKSGIMCDENGEQRQLSPSELDALRRERNRVHAKMTRDRKRMFMMNIEQNIANLERENQRLREILASQVSIN